MAVLLFNHKVAVISLLSSENAVILSVATHFCPLSFSHTHLSLTEQSNHAYTDTDTATLALKLAANQTFGAQTAPSGPTRAPGALTKYSLIATEVLSEDVSSRAGPPTAFLNLIHPRSAAPDCSHGRLVTTSSCLSRSVSLRRSLWGDRGHRTAH